MDIINSTKARKLTGRDNPNPSGRSDANIRSGRHLTIAIEMPVNQTSPNHKLYRLMGLIN